jgi:putative hydrolase
LAPEESFDLSEIELEELANLPLKNDRIIELNAKYRRPPLSWLGHLKRKQVQFHLGSDAHSLADVGNFESIRNLITFVKQDQF